MSIYDDIRKLTQIPQTDENPTFIYIGEQNIVKTKKFKQPKPPRNVNLYDPDDIDIANENYNVINHESYIPEREIALAIRKANCGVSYANEDIERMLKIRQAKARLTSNTNTLQNATVGKNNCKAAPIEHDGAEPILDTSTNERKDSEEEDDILKKCKLNKNAVIRGLLKHHKISSRDLEVSNDCMGAATYSNSVNIQEENMVPQSDLCKESYVTSAQWSGDPESFVHPLLPYGTIDETKYKNIDFTVPHIGKKKKVTARQFFINMDDTFNFVKDTKKK